MNSRQVERIRKGFLITVAIVLLAGSYLAGRVDAAPIPGASKKEGSSSTPGLVLPPPPLPQFAPALPESSGPIQTSPPAAPPKPVPAPRITATPQAKSVPVAPKVPLPPRPIPAPAPAVMPPAQEAVAPPAAVPPAAVVPAPPVASRGEWKILIRPEFYKANDPWEYVRTGGISWNNDASSTAPQRSSSAAATGDVAPPAMAGPHAFSAAASGASCNPLSYKAAYSAVPFSRAEYEANPGYRHDSAMELMFGTLRPTTIMKQTQPYFSRYPDMFRYRHGVYPYLAPANNTMDVNYYWNYPGYW